MMSRIKTPGPIQALSLYSRTPVFITVVLSSVDKVFIVDTSIIAPLLLLLLLQMIGSLSGAEVGSEGEEDRGRGRGRGSS